jgi:hypothetical protein
MLGNTCEILLHNLISDTLSSENHSSARFEIERILTIATGRDDLIKVVRKSCDLKLKEWKELSLSEREAILTKCLLKTGKKNDG